MTNKVYDLMKNSVRLTRHDGDYGIEIETETRDPYKFPAMKLWGTHNDGSLRHFGVEYVLKAPLSFGNGLEDSLVEFSEATKGLKFLDSPYTSVHVHMNILNETFKTIVNLITTYILFENVLVRYSGPERESNLFCLSTKDAEGCLDHLLFLIDCIVAKKYSKNIGEDSGKYSALNIVPYNKLGSLEVRTFRGTHDTKEILTWLKILHKIRTFAQSSINPVRIVELAFNDTPEFFRTVFGELESEFPYPDRDKLVETNLYYAAKIATRIKDWDAFGEPPKIKLTSELHKAKLDTIANAMFMANYATLNVAQRILVEEQFYLNYGDLRIALPEGDF